MTAHALSRRLPPARGFTLTEVLVALSIIAILAVMAVPSMLDRIVRGQVVEATKLADEVLKGRVADFWKRTGELPVDNAEADAPPADKIVGNFVTSMTLEDGAIHIVFGNDANGTIKGKTLTLRPAVVEDTPTVPPAWVCAGGKVPPKMTVKGRDRTDLENQYLPVNCRRLDG